MKPKTSNKGQTRVTEAVIATLIIIGALAIGFSMVKDVSALSLKQRAGNEKLAYNVLITLIRGNVIEEVIFQSNGEIRSNWEDEMRIIIDSLMPPNLLYDLKVYNYTYNVTSGKIISKIQLNKKTISNISGSSYSTEVVSSADVIYTTKRFWVISLHLELYQQ